MTSAARSRQATGEIDQSAGTVVASSGNQEMQPLPERRAPARCRSGYGMRCLEIETVPDSYHPLTRESTSPTREPSVTAFSTLEESMTPSARTETVYVIRLRRASTTVVFSLHFR